MKRRIAIASCLAVLCLAALAAWVYMKRIGQDGSSLPEVNVRTEERTMVPRVFELPVKIAFLTDDQFSPCYFDLKNKTLYRWKGVVLQREQVPNAGATPRAVFYCIA
jgi:hypothetical protein